MWYVIHFFENDENRTGFYQQFEDPLELQRFSHKIFFLLLFIGELFCKTHRQT